MGHYQQKFGLKFRFVKYKLSQNLKLVEIFPCLFALFKITVLQYLQFTYCNIVLAYENQRQAFSLLKLKTNVKSKQTAKKKKNRAVITDLTVLAI